MSIKIANVSIGEKFPSYVIAEAGINHNGSLKVAKQLIRKAKLSGANAVKFQTFKATDIASKSSPFYKILHKLELSEESFGELSDYAKNKNITFLSTPFSFDAVDILEKIKVPAYKIASGDLTHIPLIEYVAKKNKPIIISSGMSTMDEIRFAVKKIKSLKNNKILIMHSVSGYPTPENEVNLNVIPNLKKIFDYPIGFSDNGSDKTVPLIAVALGGKIIEKHFTINKKMKGPDHKISADPHELKNMIHQIRKIESMMGNGEKICQPSELKNRIEARRSIMTKVPIKKNYKITKEVITIKRPGIGLEPKYYSNVIGKKIKKNFLAEEPINWTDIK